MQIKPLLNVFIGDKQSEISRAIYLGLYYMLKARCAEKPQFRYNMTEISHSQGVGALVLSI